MHRWSKLFIPTLREAPADAEVASHKFLLRAGYIRQLGAGIYNYLPLGQRSLNKIIGIVREEMDKIGQEFYLPAILPKEPWEESGRWTGMGDNMFRLKDRKGADLCLGMTHEEIMTTIARGELRSYKQLPQIWYQIQTKFRDEPRPKSGLLRVRQFIMKDAYSFDIDAAGLDKSFDLHDAAYRAIFTRCGLKFVAVEADSGAMGGSQSQEFMVYTDAGEDFIASCPVCGYAANLEKATSRLDPVAEMEPTGDGKPELVSTPGCAAIADVAAFFKISPASDIKCVAYMALKRGPVAKDGSRKDTWHGVATFLRGDHQVNETKLLGAHRRGGTAHHAGRRVAAILQRSCGLSRPGGAQARRAAARRRPHRHRRPRPRGPQEHGLRRQQARLPLAQRDARPRLHLDARRRHSQRERGRKLSKQTAARASSSSARPSKSATSSSSATSTPKSMGARVLDPNGKEVTPIMGSYGIGIERILTAAIEQANDANGFCLAASIAPFTVVVTITNVADAALRETGEKLAAELEAAGLDVLLDDRDERAGVKFKDADLVGIPYRINVGKKAAAGQVELVTRSTSTSVDVGLNDVVALVKKRVAEEKLLEDSY